jgi:hypothetical protein
MAAQADSFCRLRACVSAMRLKLLATSGMLSSLDMS